MTFWLRAIRVLPPRLGGAALWLWSYWPWIIVGLVVGVLGTIVGRVAGPWWGALALLASLVIIPKACLLLVYTIRTVDKALRRRKEKESGQCPK